MVHETPQDVVIQLVEAIKVADSATQRQMLAIYDSFDRHQQAETMRLFMRADIPAYQLGARADALNRFFEHAMLGRDPLDPLDAYFVQCVKRDVCNGQTVHLPDDAVWERQATQVEFVVRSSEQHQAHWEESPM